MYVVSWSLQSRCSVVAPQLTAISRNSSELCSNRTLSHGNLEGDQAFELDAAQCCDDNEVMQSEPYGFIIHIGPSRSTLHRCFQADAEKKEYLALSLRQYLHHLILNQPVVYFLPLRCGIQISSFLLPRLS